MATANWQSDQPTNLNYLSPINFDLLIQKLPTVRYFCIGATLPGINMEEAVHTMPSIAIQNFLPGDRITLDPLVVRFIVDEDMINYQEIYNWIMQLAPGYDSDHFRELVGSTKTTTGFDNRSGDMTKMYSDATLVVNTSSNNPNLYFAFEDCFPTSLGSVEFVTDQTDVPYSICDLTLRYTLFKIRTTS